MTRSHEARSSPTKPSSVCEKLACQKPSGGRAAAPGAPCPREKAVSQWGAHPLLPPTPPASITCHWRAQSLRGRLPGEAMQTALRSAPRGWLGSDVNTFSAHTYSLLLSLKHSLETWQAAGSACPRLGAHREKPAVSEIAGNPGEQSGQPLTLVNLIESLVQQTWGRHGMRLGLSLVACSCLTICNSMEPTRLLCPWNFPGKNTEVGSQSLLQRIFPTQGLNPGLLHCREILYRLSHKGSPFKNTH